MGFKNEQVGYCDGCQQKIVGKGIHITGIVDFLNDSKMSEEFKKLGVSRSKLLNDIEVMLCRECLAEKLGMIDKDSQEYKNLKSSHESYIDSLYAGSR